MAHRDKVINGNGNPEAITKLSGPGVEGSPHLLPAVRLQTRGDR